MSTAAVSSNSISQQLQQYFQTRGADLQQLGRALANGNLAGAQTAYNNILKLGQNGPSAHGDPFLISQREQDFNAIGQALQAGNLAGAQHAFAALRDLAKDHAGNSGGPGGTLAQPAPASPGPEIIVNLTQPSSGGSSGTLAPPAPSSTSGSGPEIILNLGGSTGTSANPEQITINIANSANGGEQISFSVGNQNSTSQEVTLNLAPNTNEQIVLNLLGPSSSTSGSSSSSAGGGLSVTA